MSAEHSDLIQRCAAILVFGLVMFAWGLWERRKERQRREKRGRAVGESK